MAARDRFGSPGAATLGEAALGQHQKKKLRSVERRRRHWNEERRDEPDSMPRLAPIRKWKLLYKESNRR